MSRAIFGREAGRIAGVRAFHAALCAHAAGLSIFIALWGQGVGAPLIDGMSISDQLQVVQWALVACVFPWCAARCIAPERADDLVHLTARFGVRPSRLLVARAAAAALALVFLAGAGLPMVIIAQRMSDIPLSTALMQQTEIAGFAVASAVAVAILQQFLDSRIAVWLIATAVGLGLIESARVLQLPAPGRGLVAVVIAGVGAILLASRGDVTLRYLSEKAA